MIFKYWDTCTYLSAVNYPDIAESSLPDLIKSNDEMIDQAALSSDVVTGNKKESVRPPPVTDVEYIKPTDISRTTKGMKLLYLTPKQKSLYDNYMQAILRSPPGSWITL